MEDHSKNVRVGTRLFVKECCIEPRFTEYVVVEFRDTIRNEYGPWVLMEVESSPKSNRLTRQAHVGLIGTSYKTWEQVQEMFDKEIVALEEYISCLRKARDG